MPGGCIKPFFFRMCSGTEGFILNRVLGVRVQVFVVQVFRGVSDYKISAHLDNFRRNLAVSKYVVNRVNRREFEHRIPT